MSEYGFGSLKAKSPRLLTNARFGRQEQGAEQLDDCANVGENEGWERAVRDRAGGEPSGAREVGWTETGAVFESGGEGAELGAVVPLLLTETGEPASFQNDTGGEDGDKFAALVSDVGGGAEETVGQEGRRRSFGCSKAGHNRVHFEKEKPWRRRGARWELERYRRDAESGAQGDAMAVAKEPRESR